MAKFSIFIIGVMIIAANTSADQLEINSVTDEAPSHLPIVSTDAQWDTMGYFDCETPTGDASCLGVEFDGTYFYVTGGGWMFPNSVHVFDTNGIYIASYEQGTSSSWGWRDIAWDGQYLYASEDSLVTQFYVDTSGVHFVSYIPGPENPNRAMAYDPATDHFWTANWDSPIYEFDRTGTAVDTYPNTPGHSIYGMAWDDVSVDGPWLWIYSQDGSPAGLISQFDPINGVFTGFTHQGIGTDYMAGGCCFTTEWDTMLGVLFVLNQGFPDHVLGYEICSASDIEEGSKGLTSEFSLKILQNPVLNNNVRIQYAVPEESKVKLVIYNTLGQVEKVLVDSKINSGTHELIPNKHLPIGIYFVRLEAEGYEKTEKIILLR